MFAVFCVAVWTPSPSLGVWTWRLLQTQQEIVYLLSFNLIFLLLTAANLQFDVKCSPQKPEGLFHLYRSV